MTRLSAINSYEGGGLKMPDLDSMIKALRLAWLRRIFSVNKGTWKYYLEHLLKDYGGLILLSCNYNIKDLSINSQLYFELIHWWSEFRKTFSVEQEWRCIIWNNHEKRINNKTVFYKTYSTSGINYVSDLHFNLNNIESFNMITNTISKTNFLIWTGLRHSVPFDLRQTNCHPSITDPSFNISNGLFDISKKKSKDYYSMLVSTKAKLPNCSQKLKRDFNFTDDQLIQIYSLPHTVAFEPYLKAFQYKALNAILFSNTKLHKIGFIEDDKCSFCRHEPETLHHLMVHCPYSEQFWTDFKSFYFSLTGQRVQLSMRDVMFGIITSKCNLLNYLLLVGKLYLWECRRNKVLPNIWFSNQS